MTEKAKPAKKPAKGGEKNLPAVVEAPARPALHRFWFDPEAQAIKAQYALAGKPLIVTIEASELARFCACIPWEFIGNEDVLEAFAMTRRALEGITKRDNQNGTR